MAKLSGNRPANDRKRKAAIQPMEKAMKPRKIPSTDSIDELARFWDTHDLTQSTMN